VVEIQHDCIGIDTLQLLLRFEYYKLIVYQHRLHTLGAQHFNQFIYLVVARVGAFLLELQLQHQHAAAPKKMPRHHQLPTNYFFMPSLK